MANTTLFMRISIFSTLGLIAPTAGLAQSQDEAPTIPLCENPQYIAGDLTLESGFSRCEDGRVLRHAPEFIAPTFSGQLCDARTAENPGSTCRSSADCQDRSFGTCAIQDSGPFEPNCSCVYACMSDLDCNVGEICAPAALTGDTHSKCIRANCRVNKDCESAQCQISTRRNVIGILGRSSLGCRSNQDTCQTDLDCPELFDECGGCDLDFFAGHWTCVDACAVPGRPFFVQGEQSLPTLVAGTQWLNELPKTIAVPTPAQRDRIAQHWIAAARLEQASVAAFARFALQLMHLGAPPQLLADTASAMQDEIDHAKRCFTLAASYSGQAQSAGPLPLGGALEEELAPNRIAIDVFLEGCIGETIAALEAAEMTELAIDAEVRQTLQVIARDEHQHALLAWRALDWMLKHLEASQKEAVLGVLVSMVQNLKAELAGPQTPRALQLKDAAIEAHGVPGPKLQQSIRRRAIQEIILPSALALLDQRAAEEKTELRVGV